MPDSSADGFSLSSLEHTLRDQFQLAENSLVFLAYSGGLDSHVLLHALSSLAESYPFKLQAIHVNHALHADSTEWADHCQKTCNELSVALTVKVVHVSTEQGESLEAAARDARYAAIARVLPDLALCMTAQHLNDQAETMLLQLTRGAGVHGLASMPASRKLAGGRLLRPLLSYTRDDLLAYAIRHKLNWLEDPSNQDLRFDRNFLRNEILPMLRNRWPGIDKSLSRSTRHAASAAAMLDEVGLADLFHCKVSSNHFFPPVVATLQIDLFVELSLEHQLNALRSWLRLNDLRVPGDQRLQSVIKLLDEAPQKGTVIWEGGAFRLYANSLYLCSSFVVEPPENRLASWDIEEPFHLPHLQQELRAIELKGEGVAKFAIANADLTVRYRQGGEVGRMPGDYGNKSLKILLQDLSVPPWQRAGLPLIYLRDELIAVAALWVNPHYLTGINEMGVIFSVSAVTKNILKLSPDD